MITVLPTSFADAKVYVPDVFADARGYFKETYSRDKYAAAGLHDAWVQDSVSRSGRGVLRGMHADARMAKLVQCLQGEIFDVIVMYTQSAHFDPAHEFGVRWDDPEIGIAWPLEMAPVLSAKDAAL